MYFRHLGQNGTYIGRALPSTKGFSGCTLATEVSPQVGHAMEVTFSSSLSSAGVRISSCPSMASSTVCGSSSTNCLGIKIS